MTHEASEGFTRIDIEKYLDSETLARIKEQSKQRKQEKTIEEKPNTDIEKQSKLLYYFLSKMVLNTPLSIKLEKIFLTIIRTIGPIRSPIIPINLKPVYIAIKVKIG